METKILPIIRKEIKTIVREKTFLLILLVQLVIASFSAFLIVGMFSYVNPEALEIYSNSNVKLGIVGEDQKLLGYISEEGRLMIIKTSSFREAIKMFYREEIDGILVISGSQDKIIKLDIYLPKGDIKATLLIAYLKRPLERYEQYLRKIKAHGLREEIRRVITYDISLPNKKTPSSYFEFVYGILIPLLVISPAFVSGGMIIDLITEEKEKKTMDILLTSPISLKQIIIGKALVCLAMIPAQVFAWLYLLETNGIIINNKLYIVLLSMLIGLILVILGIFLAIYQKSRGVCHLTYSLILVNFFLLSYKFPSLSFFVSIMKAAIG